MKEREPNILHSSLSGEFSQDGVTVQVFIYRLERERTWSLEVVNSSGTSMVWDEQFDSEEDAYTEFGRTVAEEGIRDFLDNGNVIPLGH